VRRLGWGAFVERVLRSRKPSLSVLVCTRNRAQKAQRAVASVLANSFTDFELVVVDQSTGNATRAAGAGIADDRVRYIHTNTVGVAISRNIAIREAAADIVVFTDDDCVCDRNWLQAIVAEFAADPQALGVYGRVVPYGKAGSPAWDCVAEDGDMICPALIQSTSRTVVDGPAIPHLVVGGGNNMSFRKDAFRRVGLFNEMLGPGSRIGTGEDTEFSYRLLFNHCRLIYSPQPLVEHDNWMERPQFVHHMKVAMRVQAAVFAAYALRFDGLSVTHLLRTAWYLAGNRLGLGSAAAGLFHFATGFPWGVKLRLTAPPQLAPATASPAPSPGRPTLA
jgi:glycosyltransferase involved in cell wall biosynthesis